MDITVMVASAVAVTEFLKKAAKNAFRLEIKGAAAVVLAVLTCIGTVFVYAIKTGTALSFGLVPTLIQVIIFATMGYAIATKKAS